jgi:hypothetical protein
MQLFHLQNHDEHIMVRWDAQQAQCGGPLAHVYACQKCLDQ